MPDQPNQPLRKLSEISHLFLSSVRDKATNGSPPPQRTPPPQSVPHKPHVSLDLTPEEFAQVFGGTEQKCPLPEPADRGQPIVPPIVAIIGAHFNGRQFDRAKEYARHLATGGKRIGLIELGASEFRVMCFERGIGEEPIEPAEECSFDPRRMNEALNELSWDVDRWLLVLPTPRIPEARALLRECPQWLLLSTCDHDGVISCYRTLKGLTDLWPDGPADDKPSLALALLDPPEPDEADRISAKLVSVCQKFLRWSLESEPVVQPAPHISEHLVMCARPTRDKGQLASAPQWQIVGDLIARSRQSAVRNAVEPMEHTEEPVVEPAAEPSGRFVADVVVPNVPIGFKPAMRAVPMQAANLKLTESQAVDSDTTDVIDLPMPDSGDAGIVEAILRHCSSELIECPIAPPMCPKAKLAVGRDRRVVMLAVAQNGLADLNIIGQAYKWLQENQSLIGMAVPQLSIDTHQAPHLSLLINQSDSAAHTLQPMLQGDHVTVKTYRKLRWGGKMGLLLEAA